MELQAARQIIDTLSRGIHPATGETMEPDSPYNSPNVIRALFVVSQALQEAPVKKQRETPVNAGKPWTAEEDLQLAQKFDSGMQVREIAADFGRTAFAVETRLIKLEKMPSRVGRFG